MIKIETENQKFIPRILFEDNHLLVVLKPQMIPTQSDASGDPDLLTLLKDYIKERDSKPGNVFLGLVHRLDRPAGGVMVFAKTSKAAARLCEQIANREFCKKYLAVTVGIPRESRAHLTDYLVKDEKTNTVKRFNAAVENSKKAELEYRVLQADGDIALVEIDLITGRAHQARVQMAGIGRPLYGDCKYGDPNLNRGLKLALFAYSLSLKHPISGEAMTFRAYPPVDEQPWKFFSLDRYVDVNKPE